MKDIRLNKFIANKTGLSRRYVDSLIEKKLVTVNQTDAELGCKLKPGDVIELSDPKTNKKYSLVSEVSEPEKPTVIVLNKPIGYVCSRDGQGSPTIYDLLPQSFSELKIAGRLDKDSSGLVLMTNSGDIIDQLTHPKYHKAKIYNVTLDKNLEPLHQQMISDKGITLDDGLSKFIIDRGKNPGELNITMYEGRNRQIRRTFEALGYKVTKLHRTSLGNYDLNFQDDYKILED